MATGPDRRYQVEFTRPAAKEVAALSRDVQERIILRVTALSENPRPHGVQKLEGQTDLYRIRVGSYRVIYAIVDERLIVTVVRIADRKDVYRP